MGVKRANQNKKNSCADLRMSQIRTVTAFSA
jgi:hypothetical protein